mmetsp:Transcript_34061/g.63575  ORF Transcript_34061/g.63575 Transcript_34061/m.63575 type:complete len:216 (-) Transcript_34061:40-687(-)
MASGEVLGEVPIRVMCDAGDGFKLQLEEVEGEKIPKLSMAFTMKLNIDLHELLKTLVEVQEHETGPSAAPIEEPVQPVDGESRQRAEEACKAAEKPSQALLNAPAYADYKAQNSWEQISCPNAVVLGDEIGLREATFTPLPRPQRLPMTYAKFKAAATSLASAVSGPKWPQMKAPPAAPEKAPPGGRFAKSGYPGAVQHKSPPAWKGPGPAVPKT